MKLPCGCERGEFLCPEAERLWAEYGRTYRFGTTEECEAARKAYDTHWQDQKEKTRKEGKG